MTFVCSLPSIMMLLRLLIILRMAKSIFYDLELFPKGSLQKNKEPKRKNKNKI